MKNLLLLGLFFYSVTLVAHPFTYSICKLYIGDQYIFGNLEVSAENLIFFNYLNVDTSNYFTSDEIMIAAKAYQSSLSTSIVINSAGGNLRIEDFILGDFSVNDRIPVSELKEIFIHYSFKVKLNESPEQLNFMHKIGEAYPLISSLLILEIEGKEINQTFDNLTINELYPFSFKEKRKESSTQLSIEKVERGASIKLVTREDFLQYAVGGSENLRENHELLQEIFIIKSNGEVLSFSNVQLSRDRDHAIMISAEVDHKNGLDFKLEWKKFNQDVKIVSTELISKDTRREVMLTRYDRAVSFLKIKGE